MTGNRYKTALALAATGALVAPQAQALQGVGKPVTGEIEVRSAGAYASSVAMDADGDFVVVWRHAQGIAAQRYQATGAPLGTPIEVVDSDVPLAYQSKAVVAMDAAGNFVVAWTQGEGSANAAYGVFGRRFNADGSPAGETFQANTNIPRSQSVFDVAMDPDGDFVIGWLDDVGDGEQCEYCYWGPEMMVTARRFNADGSPASGEITVSLAPARLAYIVPSLAMDGAGNFVVAWGANARLFAADGTPRGAPFNVFTYTQGHTYNQVAMAPDGRFVVAGTTPGRTAGEVYVRRYNADGSPAGAAFMANTYTSYRQIVRGVAMDALGRFVVTWTSRNQDSSGDAAQARLYQADGTPAGDEFRVNLKIARHQEPTGIAADADGDFVITWATAPDYESSLWARRYSGSESVDLMVTKTDSPDPAPQAGQLDYALTVTNNHPPVAPTGIPRLDAAIGTATGVRITDILPAGVSYLGQSGSDWSCAPADGRVHCDRAGVMLPGTSAAVTLHARPEVSGTLTNRAVVTGNQRDAETANDRDSEATVILDTQPEPFAFVDRADIGAGATIDSGTITVTGIEAPAPLTLAGDPSARYAINDGDWSRAPAQVTDGDTVRLQLKASDTVGAAADALLQIGGVGDTWTVTSAAADAVPEAFAFADRTGLPLDAVVFSDPVTVTGINVPVGVSVGGDPSAAWSRNGMPFRTTAGTVSVGDMVRLRARTSATTHTPVGVDVSIGGMVRTWSVTTGDGTDTVPEPFAFADQAGVAGGSLAVSDPVTIGGINQPATIGVSGDSSAKYAKNGGGFTNAPGMVNAGDVLRLRLRAAEAAGRRITANLEVGGVTAAWNVTTFLPDRVPDPFVFVDQTGVGSGAVATSAPVTIGGINVPVPISLAGAAGAAWSKNGEPFTSAAGTVSSGDVVRLQVGASTTFGATVSVKATIGTLTDAWKVTTFLGDDGTPDPFTFLDLTAAISGTAVTSEPITISGINRPAAISLSGNPSAHYSKNGKAFTKESSKVDNGDVIRLRVTAHARDEETVTAVVTIGGVSDAWDVKSQDRRPDPFSFVDVTDAPLDALVVSAPVTITGIDRPTSVFMYSALYGEYSINGGEFTQAAGTVSNGDVLRLRVRSTPESLGLAHGYVSVGYYSNELWAVRTTCAPHYTRHDGQLPLGDEFVEFTTPLSGTHTAVAKGVHELALYTSAGVLVRKSQHYHGAAIDHVGAVDSYRWRASGYRYAENGAYTLCVASGPDAVAFVEQPDPPPGALVASNIVTVSGLPAPAAIRVTYNPTGTGGYSLNGGSFTAAPGTVQNGDTLQLRLTDDPDQDEGSAMFVDVGGLTLPWNTGCGEGARLMTSLGRETFVHNYQSSVAATHTFRLRGGRDEDYLQALYLFYSAPGSDEYERVGAGAYDAIGYAGQPGKYRLTVYSGNYPNAPFEVCKRIHVDPSSTSLEE